jgi:hypothetical protein
MFIDSSMTVDELSREEAIEYAFWAGHCMAICAAKNILAEIDTLAKIDHLEALDAAGNKTKEVLKRREGNKDWLRSMATQP